MLDHNAQAAALQEDHAGRRAAVTVFDTPIYLRAGAGTGKTTTLVARILAWTTGQGWERALREDPARAPSDTAQAVLAGVVAMTFTEAAAADMDRKVREELRKLSQGQTVLGLLAADLAPAAPQRAQWLLDALQGPLCTTIHAWCRGLLLRRHEAAQLDPQFGVDGDGEALRASVHDAVRADLQALASVPKSEWMRLGQEGIWPRDVADEVVRLYSEGVRHQDLDADPWSEDAMRTWLEAARALVASVVSYHTQAAPSFSKLKDWKSAFETLLDLHSSWSAVSDPSRSIEAARASCANESLFKCLKIKPDKHQKALVSALGHDHAAFAQATRSLYELLRDVPLFDREFHQAARGLVQRMLLHAGEGLRIRAVVAQSDLLRLARTVVELHPEVRRTERARLRQVLLDEVQDTDPQQYALVRQLCLQTEARTQEGSANARPGLFIVGDPKQSIYGWRNADLRALETLEHELERDHQAQVYDLVRNFRSTHNILHTVNAVVEPVMEAEAGVQPSFRALQPHRSEVGEVPIAMAIWEVPPQAHSNASKEDEFWEKNDTSAQARRRLEAQELTRELQAQLDAGVKRSSIGILSAYTGGLTVLLEALRDAGIPYEFASDRSYYRRREVRDAVAWLACIVDPQDKLSFVAALKSPVCGLTDQRMVTLMQRDLHALAARHEQYSQEARQELLRVCDNPNSDAALVHAIEALWVLRGLLANGNVEQFLAALRDLLGPEPLEAARYLGEWRAANLARFFEQVRVHLLEHGGEALSLLALLRDCLKNGRREGDAPAGEAIDAVRVMTVHSSKGLDFEQVYVVDTAHGKNNKEAPTAWDEQTKQLRLFQRPSPLWFLARRARQRREDAERVRLWYVALTRAKNRLWVSAPLPPATTGEGQGSFHALMARTIPQEVQLGTRLRTHAAAWRAGSQPEPLCISTPVWMVRTVITDMEAPRTATVSVQVHDTSTRDEAEMLALQTLRTSAQQREQRPLFAAASSLAHLEQVAPEMDAPAVVTPTGRTPLAARAAGTAVHAIFETLPSDDWEGGLAAMDPARIQHLVRRALVHTPHDQVTFAEAAQSALDTWQSFRSSTLCTQLEQIWPRVIARELPLFVAAPANETEGAVHGLRGTADMVYRDLDGSLVVVDWKTDRVADLAARSQQYVEQLKVYALALRAALDLNYTPRCELWFVAQGVLHK